MQFSWSKTILACRGGRLGLLVDRGRLGDVDEDVLDALGGGVDDQPLRDDRGVLGADFGVLGGLALLGEHLGRGRVAAEDDLALERAPAFGLDRRTAGRAGSGRRRGRASRAAAARRSWPVVSMSAPPCHPARPRRHPTRSPGRRSRRSRTRDVAARPRPSIDRLTDPACHHCISPGVGTLVHAIGYTPGRSLRRPGKTPRSEIETLSEAGIPLSLRTTERPAGHDARPGNGLPFIRKSRLAWSGWRRLDFPAGSPPRAWRRPVAARRR